MTDRALPRELVLASAGTGKTYHLSSRIIGLLEDGAEPDHVLASTFTRKAAGEILDRVLFRVARAGLDPGAARELREEALLRAAGFGPDEALALLGRLAGGLHRFEVGTLDSVFVRVARSFWPELDLPPAWEIVDDPEADRIRSEALQDVLESGRPEERAELVRMAARGRATRRVHGRLVDQIAELHRLHRETDPGAADPWSPFDEREPPADPEAAREELAVRVERTELPRKADGDPDTRWERAAADLAAELRAGDWEEVLDGGLGARALQEEPTYYGKSPTPELAACLDRIRELAAAGLGSTYADEARAMGRLARRFDEALSRRQREEGAYRFDDVTHRLAAGAEPGAAGTAGAAGGAGPATGRDDLGYRLDRSVRHLLLDEFQDTSLPQWEALRPLADRVAGRPVGESASVVVADPKQSIYGWRGADPSLVGRVGDRYGLERATLDRSWRSSPVVLDFVDRVFGELPSNPVVEALDRGPEVARRWSESFTGHRPAPPMEDAPGRVRVEVGPDADVRGNAPPAMMAHAADRIAELRERAPGATVGVLTRTNDAVARLIRELRARGVDASEEGGTSVRGAAPVAAILSLLRLADHPGDRVARYHVAATPLGETVGYTDHEDGEGARRLSEALRRRLLRDGYGETLAGWRRELASAVSDREDRRLRQLVELGYRWDGRATLRVTDFVRFVEAERVEDPTASPVRVMTVHQAKGLEFDAVVLPELDAGLTGGGGRAALPERDPDTGRVLGVFPGVKRDLRPLFPEMEEAHRQAREADLRDAFSLLYVALTRARHALHLFVSEASLGGSEAKRFSRLVLGALGLESSDGQEGEALHEAGDPGWHRALSAARGGDGSEVPESEPPEEEGAGELRIDPSASAGRLLRHRSPSDLAASAADPAEILRPGGRQARARGELVHEWLREVEWREDGLPGADRLRRIAARVASSLGADAVEALRADLSRWLEAEDARRALSRREVEGRAREHLGAPEVDLEVRTEWPFMLRRDGEVVTGQADRLVLARPTGGADAAAAGEQGVSVPGPAYAEVLDFKTDEVAGEALEEAAARYRPQVEEYRRAAADLHGLAPDDVRGALLFLPAGRLWPVS